MRSLALSLEARRRGWHVEVVASVDAMASRLWARQPAPPLLRELSASPDAHTLAAFARDLRADLVHLDAYDPALDGLAMAFRGIVSTMQDGEFGARPATVSIDANLGAENAPLLGGEQLRRLRGVEYALIRPAVRELRGLRRRPNPVPRVLVVLGGTDPAGATARVVQAVAHSETAARFTVVTPEAQRAAIEAIAARSSNRIEPMSFVPELPRLAAQHDAVISAGGTSVWDFACLGLPMGLVRVAENQRRGYDAMVSAGYALGFGGLRADGPGLIGLDALLADEARRLELGRMLRQLVDGRGVERVVNTWEAMMGYHRGSAASERVR